MALIRCAACGKRISDKSPHCPHCQQSLSTDPAALERAERMKAINNEQQLMTHSFIAMFFLVGGFAVWWWGGEAAQGWRETVGVTSMAAGSIFYLITRVRGIIAKRKR
ncbi:zinc ribbon domain-containing protein [Ferrimonas pelagia]|uniref:Zinc ribbon domain-containing protein n=1 Tax=Ferrimonas pelagia TaxID=1177826 RepID=A0ABP9FGB4_9GAMM